MAPNEANIQSMVARVKFHVKRPVERASPRMGEGALFVAEWPGVGVRPVVTSGDGPFSPDGPRRGRPVCRKLPARDGPTYEGNSRHKAGLIVRDGLRWGHVGLVMMPATGVIRCVNTPT